MSSLETQAALINKYTPVLYFHPDEKYFPCSSEWLMKNSTLIDFNDSPPKTYDVVTNQVMYDISKKYNFQRKGDGELILSFDNSLYKGEIPIRNVPIYTLFRETPNKIFITYIILYAYNGEYDILGLIQGGMHPGDIEHITVELNKSGELQRVFYSAHGTKDGRWVNKEDIEMENDKIVCYVALTGHGLYPKEGVIFRLFGVANDHTMKGQRWQPKPFQIFRFDDPNFKPDTMGFFAYNGRIGGLMEKGNTDGITGLPDKSWFHQIDNPNPEDYKPPTILSPTIGGILIGAKDIVVFAIGYAIVYNILKFISKGQPTYKTHFLTIFITLTTFAIIKIVLRSIIKKYLPS